MVPFTQAMGLQAPAAQVWPEGHALPHAPQLFVSLCGFTQLFPQKAMPAGHTEVHAPFEQLVPVWHTVPQAPQLLASLLVSTQTDPQSVRLAGQTSPASDP